MIGLDTNVLLRYLVQDDPVQSPRATEIITSQLTGGEPGFVSLVTILEVVGSLRAFTNVRGRKSQPTLRWSWQPIHSASKTSKRSTMLSLLSEMEPEPSKMH